MLVPDPAVSQGRFGAVGKRLFDITVAATLLLLLSPIFLLVFCLIKASSRGPVHFRQRRIGHGCREFDMLKFRSMRHGAHLIEDTLILDEQHQHFFKLRTDPRITPLGKWLRRFSLDELPQLWNVLTGDMSLVGPRPVLVSEFQKTPSMANHPRFQAKPGLTGLWQISGRSNCTDDERLRLDFEYTRRRSFAFDLLILIKTVPAVVSGDGAY
jgi:lipopolysaccharide/colanic/teichoic acid biosynthesis glycosyltransferase